MDERELKKLGKQELVNLLLAEKEKNNALSAEIEELKAKLNKREIAINNAGSIADASMEISGIFAAAQIAADEYIENCKRLTLRADEVAVEKEAEANVAAQKIIEDAEALAQAKYTLAEEMLASAQKDSLRIRKEADDYWSSLQVRLQSFYDEHRGLQEMLKGMRTPE